MNLVYAGPRDQGRMYSSLFNSTGLLSLDESMVTWPELSYEAERGAIAAVCARGRRQNIYTLNMKTFDAATMRKIYSNFGTFIRTNAKAASSVLAFQAFGQQGVDAVPATSSAYANRGHVNILVLIQMIYDDDDVAKAVDAWAQTQRDKLEEASGYDKLYVYQNYARGDEPLEAIYGDEAWRLEKLKTIKRAYDPWGVFNGYHNIPV
jgi:FAD/FMN-containing dehydrogenase